MQTAKSAGRTIGVLILVQMVVAFFVNFSLLAHAFDPPGFLVNASGYATLFGLAAVLGLLSGAISVGIAITAYPQFRQRSQTLALWFVALTVVGVSTAVVENINLMSMLSLSESFAKANAVDRGVLAAVRIIAASARNWAHFVGLMIAGATLLVFYAALYRFYFIPRALSVFGVVAVLLQISSVARPLFGHDVVFLMLAPLGISQLLVSIWLVAKGLRSNPPIGLEPAEP